MGGIGRAGVPWRMQRTRPSHRARQQHLRSALMAEIAISEAHARHRSAEAALISPVEIETGLEWNPFDRGADGLTADLQRITGETQVTNGTGSVELHRASRTHVVEYPACAACAVEASECEHLAGYELAGLIGTHHPGDCGRDHQTDREGPQHETRKHVVTPTSLSA